VLFLAPPLFLLFYFAVAKVDGCPCLSRLCFGREGRGGGGWRGERGRRRDERGPAAAQRKVRRTKKTRQGGKWRGVALGGKPRPSCGGL
jgi:hypothetical protein